MTHQENPATMEPDQSGNLPTSLENVPDGARATELETAHGADVPALFIAHNLPGPLAQEYQIIRRLGLGGQGTVYLCERLDDRRQVAIKLYSVAMSRLDTTVINKLAEASSTHIVPTAFGQWGEECWEIQEYLPLGTVADIRSHFDDKLPDSVAQEIVSELANAVAAAHDLDLLHRDIKPSNILVRSTQPLDLVLADFGLVRNLMAGAQVGSRSATPGYRSPDTAQGIWRLESDWWAVGITIYEVLTQRHPFDNESGYRKDDLTILGYLVENEVPLDGIEDPRWLLLLRGLLTKSADHRWGINQIRDWLAGGSPDVYRAAPAADRGWSFAGFGGQEFTSHADLGRALVGRWDEAAEFLSGRGRRTLHNALAQSSVAAQAHQIFDRHDKKLIGTDGMVFELARLLAPGEPLQFRGRLLTPEGLTQAASEAARGSESAARWIRTLRTEHVLANTMGHQQHAAFTKLDDDLGRYWDKIDRTITSLTEARRSYQNQALGGRSASADIRPALTESLAAWEGELLKAALNPNYSSDLQATVADGAARHPATAPWIDSLQKAVSSKEPAVCEALMLTAVNPLADSDHGEAQAVEEARARREAAEAVARRREQRAARLRAARPNEGDFGLLGLAIAGCVTVLVPWILGATPVLRDKFGRDSYVGGDADDIEAFKAARSLGDYFKSDWTAGCVALLIAVAVILALRALMGRRSGAVILGAVPFVAALFLMPVSGRAWDDADAKTRASAYDPEFNDFATCGGVVSDTNPKWSMWTFRIKNSTYQGEEFDGCNRVALYRGLERIDQVDLNQPQWTYGGGWGSASANVSVNDAASTDAVVFTYRGDRGRPVTFRVADYE